jgi:ubiquinone/menaquinone biosynthesis C-methylase UbiE
MRIDKRVLRSLTGLALLAFIGYWADRVLRAIHSMPMPAFLIDVIDNPPRRWLMPPDVMAMRHGVEPGLRVLEIGPGSGTYTIAAARRAGPTGRVVAIDIQPAVVRHVQRRILREGVTNLEVELGDVHYLPFPDETFDALYMMTVIGEIPGPAQAMRSFYRVLRPGGTIAFTETWLDPDYPTRRTLTRWATDAGFEACREFTHPLFYTLVFRKPLQKSPGARA